MVINIPDGEDVDTMLHRSCESEDTTTDINNNKHGMGDEDDIYDASNASGHCDSKSGHYDSTSGHYDSTSAHKVKPYNVVDLSTHQTLTEEEVYQCMKDAFEKELQKKFGLYDGYNAKPNGDPPNFITPPPRGASKSVASLRSAWQQNRDGYDEPNACDEENESCGGSGNERGRANTAPANYQLLRSEQVAHIGESASPIGGESEHNLIKSTSKSVELISPIITKVDVVTQDLRGMDAKPPLITQRIDDKRDSDNGDLPSLQMYSSVSCNKDTKTVRPKLIKTDDEHSQKVNGNNTSNESWDVLSKYRSDLTDTSNDGSAITFISSNENCAAQRTMGGEGSKLQLYNTLDCNVINCENRPRSILALRTPIPTEDEICPLETKEIRRSYTFDSSKNMLRQRDVMLRNNGASKNNFNRELPDIPMSSTPVLLAVNKFERSKSVSSRIEEKSGPRYKMNGSPANLSPTRSSPAPSFFRSSEDSTETSTMLENDICERTSNPAILEDRSSSRSSSLASPTLDLEVASSTPLSPRELCGTSSNHCDTANEDSNEHSNHYDTTNEHSIEDSNHYDTTNDSNKHLNHYDTSNEHSNQYDTANEHSIEDSNHYDTAHEHSKEHSNHYDTTNEHSKEHSNHHDTAHEHSNEDSNHYDTANDHSNKDSNHYDTANDYSNEPNHYDTANGSIFDEDDDNESFSGYAVPEDSIRKTSITVSGYLIPMDCESYRGDEEDGDNVSYQIPYWPRCESKLEPSDDINDDTSSKNLESKTITSQLPYTSRVANSKGLVVPPLPPRKATTSSSSTNSRSPSTEACDMYLPNFNPSTACEPRNHSDKQDDDIDLEFAQDRDRLESDVFYNNVNFERTSTRASSRSLKFRKNKGSTGSDTPSEKQEKKKKSKIKNFFKKLSTSSNKKDEKLVLDSELSTELNTNHHSDNSAVTSRLPSSRRGSENVELLNKITPRTAIEPTPLSKRRMFSINLSFMKKGRREKSKTDFVISETENVPDVSDTIRALCSPNVTRRTETNPLRRDERGSDPSLNHIDRSIITPLKKKYRAPDPPPHNSRLISPDNKKLYERETIENSTHNTIEHSNLTQNAFGNSNHSNYANYPFSKVNMKAPIKPQRSIEGYTTEPINNSHHSPTNNHDNTVSIQAISSDIEHLTKGIHRSESFSSDSSIMSTDSITFQKCRNQPDNVSTRSTSALRKTPLTHSVANYDKLFEVHKQTIDRIAFGISSLRCECNNLHDLEWDDFERTEDMIQLGLHSYMVVPVTCSRKFTGRRFYAWLRMSQQHGAAYGADYPIMNFSKSTLHRNCIHACHIMQQNYSAPFQDGIPKSIEIECVYLSNQCPKMTLTKYISLTLDKHTRYPEIYEREATMILLQVVKGIQYLHNNGACISSINSDNIFILNNGHRSVVLSLRDEPNRCPSVAIAVLPGLGNLFEKSGDNVITNLCYQLVFLLYDLLHFPYQYELNEDPDISVLLKRLPSLMRRSIYSQYLQYVINLLLDGSCHVTKSLNDLQMILEIILFGPGDISGHTEEEGILLLHKWHNRRCVDMVTHILKEAPLIMLCGSEPSSHDVEKIKNIDQEILLECEFLSSLSPSDVHRISKLLNPS